MAKGVKHYFKSGKEYKGATHKDTKGRLMSGKTHTASSKYLVHKKDLKKAAIYGLKATDVINMNKNGGK
jgi:hypothetical protein